MTEIKLENVSYAYDEQQILKDISLQVEAGQVVAILGPSGVGKTTLFNLIAGIGGPVGQDCPRWAGKS